MFDPINKTKLADQLAASMRKAIVGGDLKEGDRMPSERALADRFGVNRSSVREALLRLEAWGLVDIRHGGGTRIRNIFQSAGLQLLPYLVAPSGVIDAALLKDILSIRVMLLGWTAEQAALLAQPADIVRLEASLAALDEAVGLDAVQEADFDFFSVMVDLTGNRVLGLFANAIRAVYEQNGEHFAFLYGDPAAQEASVFHTRDHHAAVVAIASGNPEAAHDAMKRCALRSLQSVEDAP